MKRFRPLFSRQHWTRQGKPKEAFESLQEAVADLRRRRLLGHRWAYQCPVCRKFHTGRKRPA